METKENPRPGKVELFSIILIIYGHRSRSLHSLRFTQEVISLDAFMTEHIQFNCA